MILLSLMRLLLLLSFFSMAHTSITFGLGSLSSNTVERSTVCALNSCLNGYCIAQDNGTKCNCYEGWTGDKCDVDIDECAGFNGTACYPGSTCKNTQGSYDCICAESRTGPTCEREVYHCASDHDCLNGGLCQNETCICQSEFEGSKCELTYDDPCIAFHPCMDHQICISNRSEKNGYKCECPSGFGGRFCEALIDNLNTTTHKIDVSKCSLRGCSKLAGNGICDRQCNYLECGFDGGDCAVGTVPFSRCPHAAFCANRYNNGECDKLCDNSNCLNDGFDCTIYAPELHKHGSMFGMTLNVLVKPETFVRNLDWFLSSLAQRLRTSVILSKTDGKLDVFEFNDDTGKGARIDFGWRTDARVDYPTQATQLFSENVEKISGMGVMADARIFSAECSQECFKSIFIASTAEKEVLW